MRASILAVVAAALLSVASTASAQVKHIQNTNPGGIADAVWVGDTLYVSGQLPSPTKPADRATNTPAVWGNTNDAAAKVGREATTINVLFHDLGGYPQPLRDQMRNSLVEYTHYVIDQEWPKHQIGEAPISTLKLIDDAQQALFGYEPATEGQKIIHARWSGEACWIPLGEFELGVSFENHTSHPSVGDLLFYPGGYSETEIILAYGSCCFASKMGQLAGNHFLTIGIWKLLAMGEKSEFAGLEC